MESRADCGVFEDNNPRLRFSPQMAHPRPSEEMLPLWMGNIAEIDRMYLKIDFRNLKFEWKG